MASTPVKAVNYASSKLTELKQMCKDRKLKVSGLKAELVQRLTDYDLTHSSSTPINNGVKKTTTSGVPSPPPTDSPPSTSPKSVRATTSTLQNSAKIVYNIDGDDDDDDDEQDQQQVTKTIDFGDDSAGDISGASTSSSSTTRQLRSSTTPLTGDIRRKQPPVWEPSLPSIKDKTRFNETHFCNVLEDPTLSKKRKLITFIHMLRKNNIHRRLPLDALRVFYVSGNRSISEMPPLAFSMSRSIDNTTPPSQLLKWDQWQNEKHVKDALRLAHPNPRLRPFHANCIYYFVIRVANRVFGYIGKATDACERWTGHFSGSKLWMESNDNKNKSPQLVDLVIASVDDVRTSTILFLIDAVQHNSHLGETEQFYLDEMQVAESPNFLNIKSS